MSNDIEREAFEREFPVPDGVVWADSVRTYLHTELRYLSAACAYTQMWEVWQVRAQQGEAEPVANKEWPDSRDSVSLIQLCDLLNGLMDGTEEKRYGLLEPWKSTYERLCERLSTAPIGTVGGVPEGFYEQLETLVISAFHGSDEDDQPMTTDACKEGVKKLMAILTADPSPEQTQAALGNGWIRCSERLPEFVGHYDAFTPTDGGRYPDAYWNGERWENEMGGIPIRGVTHYCEPSLPQPPAGQEGKGDE